TRHDVDAHPELATMAGVDFRRELPLQAHAGRSPGDRAQARPRRCVYPHGDGLDFGAQTALPGYGSSRSAPATARRHTLAARPGALDPSQLALRAPVGAAAISFWEWIAARGYP